MLVTCLGRIKGVRSPHIKPGGGAKSSQRKETALGSVAGGGVEAKRVEDGYLGSFLQMSEARWHSGCILGRNEISRHAGALAQSDWPVLGEDFLSCHLG